MKVGVSGRGWVRGGGKLCWISWFSGGILLRDAQAVVVYKGLRRWRGSQSNESKKPRGAAEERPRVCVGSGGGGVGGAAELDMINAWRILGLGRSIWPADLAFKRR